VISQQNWKKLFLKLDFHPCSKTSRQFQRVVYVTLDEKCEISAVNESQILTGKKYMQIFLTTD